MKLKVISFGSLSILLFYENFGKDKNPQALLIDEVEIGQSYEVVLTTRGGLYRYRNGDVVEVVGFHEKCPVIQFKYRLWFDELAVPIGQKLLCGRL